MFRKLIAAIIIGSAVSAVGVSAAYADCSSGFIANALCNAGVINQQTANGLDAAHAAAARPLDHMANQAAGAAANYVVPGSGPYVTNGLEMRDQFNRSGGFRGAGFGGGQPAPMIAPVNTRPMGNVCYTQVGAYPGPFNPIGSGCTAATPWGMAGGVVGQ